MKNYIHMKLQRCNKTGNIIRRDFGPKYQVIQNYVYVTSHEK